MNLRGPGFPRAPKPGLGPGVWAPFGWVAETSWGAAPHPACAQAMHSPSNVMSTTAHRRAPVIRPPLENGRTGSRSLLLRISHHRFWIASRTAGAGIAGRRSFSWVPEKRRRLSVTSVEEIRNSLESIAEVAPWRMKCSICCERLPM